MLQRLQVMREGMYQGYYILDTFRYRADENKAKHEVSQCHYSFALSRFNPAKRLCLHISNTKMLSGIESMEELHQMLGSLESMIAGMHEFVIFLVSYPRISRQPYNTYLLLDKCMFGRQMEMEQIISFLLQAKPNGNGNLGVLPIVGSARVGKRTLVEHVCNDERVRNYFSCIVLLSRNDLEDEELHDLGHFGVIKHQNRVSHKSSLVIIELADDEVLDQGRWKRFYSSASCLANGSKVIITSRSERIQSFGTVEALKLNFLPQEAYWYFFKVISFGSANPEEHSELASIAMDIAAELRGSFMGANIVGSLLRANLDAQFWCRILKCLREYTEKHRFLFGEHPHDLFQKNRPIYFWRLAETSKFFLCYNRYQTCSAQNEVPKITLLEVFSGKLKPHGRFEALAWRSHIPPYYNYSVCCVMQTPPHMLIKKKRSRQQII